MLRAVSTSTGYLKNAFKRTLLAFLPHFAQVDNALAKQYLSEPEYGLFIKMDVRDCHHALLVVKTLLETHPTASTQLTRAAFLHDVGKSRAPYNPVTRILTHLYTPNDLAAEPRFKGIRGAWQLNKYHDRYGAAMIREAGGCERVADIVEHHHDPQNDVEAAILKEIDERF